MAWATDRGLVLLNPCELPGKPYRAARADAIWTEADETALLRVVPARISLAYLLAAWTGQRKGDLLRLTWTAYDGQRIRLRQSKRGKRVVIPVSGNLKAALDAAYKDKQAVTILSTTRGTPWTSDGFDTEWRKVKVKAKITGLTFHDLRGTAVTRLALAGCSEPEIATFTGHSFRDVAAILDAHNLSRDPKLAEAALIKREAHEKRTNTPN
jgi:integrase